MSNKFRLFIKEILIFVKYFIVFVSIVIVIVIGILGASGSIRHKVFRTAIELPGLVYYFRLRAPVLQRNFLASAQILDSQLRFVQGFIDGQNTMLPGLLVNTSYVIREVSFQGESEQLIPFLGRLTTYQPDIFLPYVWLAEASIQIDPERSLSAAKKAIELIPTDDRPYRLGIRAAEILGDEAEKQELCMSYPLAEFGGIHHYQYNTLFGGIGIRSFGLEVVDLDGESKLFAKNNLTIGNQVIYTFNLDRETVLNTLFLHLGVVPGLRITFHELALWRSGELVSRIPATNVNLSARRGFFVNKSLLTTSRDGDKLSFDIGKSNKIETDQIRLILSVEKMSLFGGDLCSTLLR